MYTYTDFPSFTQYIETELKLMVTSPTIDAGLFTILKGTEMEHMIDVLSGSDKRLLEKSLKSAHEIMSSSIATLKSSGVDKKIIDKREWMIRFIDYNLNQNAAGEFNKSVLS